MKARPREYPPTRPMQSPVRTPAPIPPITSPDELRTLYTRVHWLNIAEMDKTIAENERALATMPADSEPEWARTMLINAAPLVVQRRDEYLRDFEHLMRQTDDRSLETMRRFIGAARELHAKKPEFAFLFEAAPAATDSA